jgi:hypothetical protein
VRRTRWSDNGTTVLVKQKEQVMRCDAKMVGTSHACWIEDFWADTFHHNDMYHSWNVQKISPCFQPFLDLDSLMP